MEELVSGVPHGLLLAHISFLPFDTSEHWHVLNSLLNTKEQNLKRKEDK